MNSSKENFKQSDAQSEMQEWIKSVENHTRKIQINPKLKNSFYYRGKARYELEDYDGAIADFSEHIDFDPKFEVSY